MADINAKIDVKRNGRGQIISYGVENTATYSPILLSDTNRQPLTKYSKSSFFDNVDAEIKSITQRQDLEDANLSVEITNTEQLYVPLTPNIEFSYIANLSEVASGFDITSPTSTPASTSSPASTGNYTFDVGTGQVEAV
jgi:hypothetical protein